MSPVNTNDKQPVKVSNVEVENLPGGAKISYTLPTSENILYIKAIYEIRDGVEQEVKSSYYNRSLLIEGFPDTQEYDVKLYTVSHGEVESEPLTVQVRSEEHTSELQSLMRISYAVFCLKKKK